MSMAMSDTGSSFAQWAGLYHHEPSLEPATGYDDGGVAAVDGNNVAATSPTSGGSAGGSPTKAGHHPGVDGARVGKPARRRSRASRRAPVTLLNTDTANFRAMVQQFTGIPAPPAGAFAGPAGVPVINFYGDYGFPPPASVMSFDHLGRSHQPPATLQDQLRRQQHQQQQYTGATFGYGNQQGTGPGAGGDFFAHGLASAEDRMLLQSMQAAQMQPASAANNSASGFFT